MGDLERNQNEAPKPRCPYQTMSPGFTLIEVMVAVMIISVVIASLLQLFSTNTHLLGGIGERAGTAMRSTLLLGIGDHGFEQSTQPLDTLVESFKIDDDLRRRLKGMQLELDYSETMRFGADRVQPVNEAAEKEENADARANVPVFEIGMTSSKIDEQQTSFVRIRLQ